MIIVIIIDCIQCCSNKRCNGKNYNLGGDEIVLCKWNLQSSLKRLATHVHGTPAFIYRTAQTFDDGKF